MIALLLALLVPFAHAGLNSLPNSNVGIDSTSATGTTVGTKTAADTMLIDRLGNAFGTEASPFVVSSQATALGAQGKQFLGGTGAISIAAAGQFKTILTNPVGSGVTLIINAITVVNSNLNLTAIGTLVLNPTGNLPTVDGYRNNFQLATGTAPKATLKYDSGVLGTALTGGTTILTIGIPPGRTVYNQGFFYVPPGNTIGLNAPYAGVGTVELAIYWSEI